MVNKASQLSKFHVVDEHEESPFVEVRKMMSDDVFVKTNLHHCNFLFKLVQHVLWIDYNYPDCVQYLGQPMFDFENLAHTPSADLTEKLEVIGWLWLDKHYWMQFVLELFCSQQLLFKLTLEQVAVQAVYHRG